MASPIILSFSGGLLSPYLNTRVDQEKYYSGCRIMSGMIALPYGPAMRAPGTEFIATEKTQSKKVKLFPFKYSVDQAYILEFGHQYVRFYKDGGQIVYDLLTLDVAPGGSGWAADDTITGNTSGATCIIVTVTDTTHYIVKHVVGTYTLGEVLTNGVDTADQGASFPTITASTTPAEISTVYTEDDLFDLHVVGLNDVMDIVHTQHTIKPYRLSRLAHDDWTITAKDFTYGPFLDENTEKAEGSILVEAVNVALAGTASETGSTLGTSSGAIANTNDEDYATYWQRRGYSSVDYHRYQTVYAKFTIEVEFASTVAILDRVKYWLGWVNNSNGCGDLTYARTVSCEVKYDGSWHVIGTSTNTSIEISGPWYDVTHVKIYMYTWMRGYGIASSDRWVQAIAKLFELEAWTPEVSADSTPISITPTNTNTYSRTLDNAAAVDQGGTPNIVRIPSTAHGFLAGDYVTILGTTNYDGLYKITNIDVDTFDIESAYTVETFTGTESAVSFITLSASSSIFTSDHVGSIWQLIQKTAESRVKGTFTSVTESDSIRCSGGWTFVTEGNWIGDIELQRSYDKGSTWYPYRQFTRMTSSANNYYVPDGNEDEEDVYYRVAMTARTSGDCNYCFTVNDNTVKGIVKITGYITSFKVRGEVLVTLGDTTATKKWNEGAWSDERGYPGAVGLYQQRSVFGGSTYRPQFIWSSRTGDYENMRTGVLDSHAFIYELASGNQDFIRWMIGFSEILIGTQGAEHKLGAPARRQALTPTNVSQDIQSTYGSSDIQPIIANDVVLYWGRQRRKLWELVYSYDAEGYVSRDLALYAENITEGGIVDMAYQQQPFPIVWPVRADGKLLGMTFLRAHKVEGWHIHPTDGDTESVAVIPSSGEDEVWLSVKRTISDSTKRYIERMKPHSWGTDQKDCFFVHSGLTFDGGDAVDVSDIAIGADPYKVTITATAHGFSNGHQVKFADVGGMTELNGKVFTVSDKADNTFILKDETDSMYITGENFTTYTSGGTVQRVENVMTGLGHLEGKEVAILADGIPLPGETVSSSQITIDEYANKVHVGLPYVSELMPMNIELGSQQGTILAKTKRIISATLNFYESAGCEFGTDEDHLEQLSFMKFSDTMGEPTPLFTGDKKVSFAGGYNTMTNLYIRQTLPLPLTVLSIIPEIALSD